MTLIQVWIAAGTLLLSAGIFLLCYCLMTWLSEWSLRFWHRFFRSWANRRLREMGVIQEKPFQAASLDWRRLFLLMLLPILAFTVRDAMLALLILIVGMGILFWINFQSRQKDRSRVNEDAEVVALQIRSLISLDHSLLNALSRIGLADGQMKLALHQVVMRLQMHQPPAQAVQALRGLPGLVTGRLSALIANSSSLTDAIQEDLLLSLEQEAHRQRLLRSKTRQTLALVRGTIRLLQGVVAAALFFVIYTPTWREFFLQDLPHHALLVMLIAASALASLYFEYEVYQLGIGEMG
jgi:hypothetical protein